MEDIHKMISGQTLKHINRTLRVPFNRYSAFKRLGEFHAMPFGMDTLIDWAMKYPSAGYMKVGSIQIRSEIMALAQAVAALKPKNILEIGTARGGTLFIWANLASARVISCDLEDAGIKRELYEAFPPPESRCKVTHLSGDSHDKHFREKVEAELGGEQVDFLFIDGDHTETGVEADYNDYHHLVRPGGIIAFHDIVEKQAIPTNQVYYFWQRLKQQAEFEEFIDDPGQTGYGIGIIRVPEKNA